MAEGRNRAEWARCAGLLAMLANVHRRAGTPPFAPSDFDPFARTSASAQAEPAHAVPLASLKSSLVALFPETTTPAANCAAQLSASVAGTGAS